MGNYCFTINNLKLNMSIAKLINFKVWFYSNMISIKGEEEIQTLVT